MLKQAVRCRTSSESISLAEEPVAWCKTRSPSQQSVLASTTMAGSIAETEILFIWKYVSLFSVTQRKEQICNTCACCRPWGKRFGRLLWEAGPWCHLVSRPDLSPAARGWWQSFGSAAAASPSLYLGEKNQNISMPSRANTDWLLQGVPLLPLPCKSYHWAQRLLKIAFLF